MKRLQIIGTRPYSHPFPIVSWLIRLCQWSKESHVSIYFPEKEIVRHAHFNNIKEESIDNFSDRNRITDIQSITLTEEEYNHLDSFTANSIGKQKGYWLTLLGSFIPQLARRIFNARWGNPFYKGITCSEFVRSSFKLVDEKLIVVLTNNIPKGTFTTSDALKLTKEMREHR